MMFKDILKLVLLGRFFLIFFFMLLLFILKIYSYPAPFYSLFFLLFISGLFNFNYFFRKKFTNYDKYFFLQLNLDLTWISLFFYFLGGYHNPLIFLMLLPLVSAALILNKRYLTIYFVEYIIIFILICFNSKPLSHLLMNYYGGISGNLYLWGVLISFLIVSLVIVFNLFWIIKLNKINEKEFSQAKEVLLKKDKNILLTTFAATTAHQLGTPLAIIAMKYEELKKFIKDKNAEMALNEIKAQIFKCKEIIKSINNFETSIKYKKLSLNNFLKLIQDHYLQIPISKQLIFNSNIKTKFMMKYDDMLFHSITHIIDNAVQNSLSKVHMSVILNKEHLIFQISNDGKKLNRKILESKPISEKDFGMGMGIYLSKIIIERYYGEIQFNFKNKQNIINILIPTKTISI